MNHSGVRNHSCHPSCPTQRKLGDDGEAQPRAKASVDNKRCPIEVIGSASRSPIWRKPDGTLKLEFFDELCFGTVFAGEGGDGSAMRVAEVESI